MRARAVIGANFGDEGKGLVTDYLCAQGAGMVVRYNGGAQAGHTVVTPEGHRHVFSHFGSGCFLGVPTFLSQFFICNPIQFVKEAVMLRDLGLTPTVYAHPNCLVTTFADMIINQRIEDKLHDRRHGSCGLGVHETIMRSEAPHLKITMSDLWNRVPLEDRLKEICTKYTMFRTGEPIHAIDSMIVTFTKWMTAFAEQVHPLGIQQCPDPVFEGAQGLLLDQNNKTFFPHVTHSNTGAKNVKILCEQAGITDVELYYVSRTYLTRHGAGPLPGWNDHMAYHDNTNIKNRYQGELRFAHLDVDHLAGRIASDAKGTKSNLVLTHCDQLAAPIYADLYFNGPTRNDCVTHADQRKIA